MKNTLTALFVGACVTVVMVFSSCKKDKDNTAQGTTLTIITPTEGGTFHEPVYMQFNATDNNGFKTCMVDMTDNSSNTYFHDNNANVMNKTSFSYVDSMVAAPSAATPVTFTVTVVNQLNDTTTKRVHCVIQQ